MSKARIIGVLCLCCFLVVTLAAGSMAAGVGKPYEKAVTTARTEIWRAINAGKCGSATVAIMVDGAVVYSEGFGMADRVKSIPVDGATLFNMGSISKMYVATSIMLLVEDGKVSLDRPVTDYLPEFRMADWRYKKITVRMLLNHTSGLPGTENSNSFGYRYNGNVKRETIETLARAHLKHEPGAMAVYCNDGFTLAEMIVERMSGLRYIDFLAQRIFKPLDLKNTGASVGDMKGKPVALYYDVDTGRSHPPETLSILGAGGLSSNALDLCRFVDAFSPAGTLLKKTSIQEMRSAQPSAFKGKLRNPTFSYGLGWDLTSLPRYDRAGFQVLGKSGGTGNYSSMVYTVPDRRISVAVIASGDESGAMMIALDILDAVLVGRKLIEEKEKTLAIPPQAEKLPDDHALFAGYYGSESTLGEVVFDEDRNNATVYTFKNEKKKPVATLIFNDGYYHDDDGNRFYFAAFGREHYLVSSVTALGIDMIKMQKVRPVEAPRSLRIEMDGKLWLRRNVSSYESLVAAECHAAKSLLYDDLPGYVDFGGLKRIESPEFAGMPFDAIRDQSELTLCEKNGATWAWVSDLLYSPAEGTTVLRQGQNSVKIEADGYGQWLTTKEDMVLGFSKPEQGRVIVFSPDISPVYDSSIDTGNTYASAGSYIVFAGFPGDAFTVSAKPPATGKKQ